MKFGLTEEFPCSYLDQKEEQLLVFINDEEPCSVAQYEILLNAGFRRSGEQIYRPHCTACKACQSIRIPVAQFLPSKSQKRIISRNKDIEVRYSDQDKPEYFTVYQNYINQRHIDGSMYPASVEQYQNFINSVWMTPLFFEFYLADKLIAVAVTDNMNYSLSALYTFFQPEYHNRSLGTFAILQQITHAKAIGKTYLYLGYQIDQCQKMNYKSKFLPHQRFFEHKWQLFTKKDV